MTNQEKKSYLNRYREAINEIDSITEEMARIRSNAMRITPVITDMPKGGYGVNNRLQEAMEKLERCAERLQDKSAKLHETMAVVENAIDSVPDNTLQTLLRYRYINGLPFKEISQKMNYDCDYCRNLHGIALQRCETPHTITHSKVIK